jgi:hypothetical protein
VRRPIQPLTYQSSGVEADRLAAATELLAKPNFLLELKNLTATEAVSNANNPAYLANGGREAYHKTGKFFTLLLRAAATGLGAAGGSGGNQKTAVYAALDEAEVNVNEKEAEALVEQAEATKAGAIKELAECKEAPCT